MAGLEHEPSRGSNFLLPGKEALENKILGAVTKGKPRNGEGGTRHSAADCPFLILAQGMHMKLGNIFLCVLQPSTF